MRRLSGYSMLCLLALILTGCFQTAGNAVEPTIALATATAPLNPTLVPAPPTIGTQPLVGTSGGVNGGGTNVTMIATAAPTQLMPPTVPASNPPTVSAASDTPNAAVPIGTVLIGAGGGTTITATVFTGTVVIGTAVNATATQSLLVTALGTDANNLTPTSSVLSGTASSGVLYTPTPFASEGPCTHTVQPNEHLYSIARQYKVSYDDLLAANPSFTGRPDQLQPGDVLRIPNCGQPSPAAQATNAPQSSATAQPQPSAPVQPTLTGGAQPYTVAAGDSLTVIAHKFGVTVAQIKTANGLTSDRLSIGQKLIIPPPSG